MYRFRKVLIPELTRQDPSDPAWKEASRIASVVQNRMSQTGAGTTEVLPELRPGQLVWTLLFLLLPKGKLARTAAVAPSASFKLNSVPSPNLGRFRRVPPILQGCKIMGQEPSAKSQGTGTWRFKDS